MNIKQYLARIQYYDTPRVDLATLGKLQVAHMRAVPFENLSIPYQQPTELNESHLFTKIVEHKRGGFCYELNGLFGQLLKEIGFRVVLISAQVCQQDGRFGPAFDHLALLVELDDVFLVVVGFGDSFRQPLRLQERRPQGQGTTVYQLSQGGEYYLLHQQNRLDPTAPGQVQYRFTRQTYQLADFTSMCVYHQTSVESHFTQKRICSRATADGRITLSNRRLLVTRGLNRTEVLLATEEEVLHALHLHIAGLQQNR
jgi:N-hydroxyarylamine O-acetyltransferase